MIRYRLKELIADREFREERVITLAEVAERTGFGPGLRFVALTKPSV